MGDSSGVEFPLLARRCSATLCPFSPPYPRLRMTLPANRSPRPSAPCFRALICFCLALPVTNLFAQATRQKIVPIGEEPVLMLSPFQVNASRDVGFVAASSLAGGRLAGDLK